jgi:hypothetical protein
MPLPDNARARAGVRSYLGEPGRILEKISRAVDMARA